jgi:hypothetical protein
MLFDALFHRPQVAGTRVNQTLERPYAQAHPSQILPGLTCALKRQEWLLHEGDSHGSYRWSLLHWCRDAFWKSRFGDLRALGTPFLLGLILSHHEPFGGNIPCLPSFDVPHWLRLHIVLAMLTPFHRLGHHFIWFPHLIPCLPCMPSLPAGLLPTFLSLTALGRAETIG